MKTADATQPSSTDATSPSLTIRSRLLLLVLAALLPALVAMAWAVGSGYMGELQARERSLRDLSGSLAMVVELALARRVAIAQVLSQSDELDSAPQLSPLQLTAFEQHARRVMDGLSGWIELRSAAGLLLSTQGAPGQVALTLPLTPATPLLDRPSVSSLIRSEFGDVRSVVVHVPVVREGRTVLNLGVTILPQELQSIIDDHRVRIDGAAIIADRSRAVVARYPEGSAKSGQPLSPQLWHELGERGDAMLRTAGPDQSPTLSHVQRLDNGWTVVSEAPQPQWARLPGGVGQVALGATLLLALATAGALWVSRQIASAVDRLRDAAQRLQHGKPVAPMFTGVEECDQVAAALVQAGASMRNANIELQRQVDAAVQTTRRAQQSVANGQRVEALGRLTGGVAHDFNNLLGVISNSAYLIRRHAAEQPEVQSSVHATLRAVQAGSRLSTQLLRFAGRQPVRPRPIDLNEFLPDVSELLRTVLGARIILKTHVQPQTRAVVADLAELELALTNLALSARASMPQGGTLEIVASNFVVEPVVPLNVTEGAHDCLGSTALDAAPRPLCVQIVVSDNGKGFTDEQVNHLFEPFAAPDQRGGMTLAQVRGFCVQSGGKVTAASTPGLGTAITMVLPANVVRSKANDPEAGATPSPAPSADDVNVAGARMLLVEDNEDVRDATAALLQTLGLHVTRANDAAQALRILIDRAEAFDIVLSDVSMHGAMDGLALARTLRWRVPKLPVVLISGYTADNIDPLEFEVLPKPCPPEVLLQALRRALGTSKAVV